MTQETTPVRTPTPPLDEIMLAMDVVDTLRHREELIQRELDSEGQEHALVAHIQHIYASQGIDVSEGVIADAIRALREDRFVYKAPRRTLPIRLAEVYVDRERWARRLVVSAALVTAGFISWRAGPMALRSWRGHELSREVRQLATLRADLEDRAKTITASLDREAQRVPELVQRPASSLISEARSELARTTIALAPLGAETLAGGGDAEGRGGEALSGATQRSYEALAQARRELGSADSVVSRLIELDRLAITAEGERQSILASARDEAAKQEALRRWDRVRSSLDRGETPAATSTLEDLNALRSELDLVYDLRIESRPGEPTGIWRHPRSNPSARNYYIVVEPVVAGRVIELPVLSEETHVVKRVRRFGVHVPAEVYERIRADKADDGLLRDDRFGEKRAGELAPQYRHPVVGGFITEW